MKGGERQEVDEVQQKQKQTSTAESSQRHPRLSPMAEGDSETSRSNEAKLQANDPGRAALVASHSQESKLSVSGFGESKPRQSELEIGRMNDMLSSFVHSREEPCRERPADARYLIADDAFRGDDDVRGNGLSPTSDAVALAKLMVTDEETLEYREGAADPLDSGLHSSLSRSERDNIGPEGEEDQQVETRDHAEEAGGGGGEFHSSPGSVPHFVAVNNGLNEARQQLMLVATTAADVQDQDSESGGHGACDRCGRDGSDAVNARDEAAELHTERSSGDDVSHDLQKYCGRAGSHVRDGNKDPGGSDGDLCNASMHGHPAFAPGTTSGPQAIKHRLVSNRAFVLTLIER